MDNDDKLEIGDIVIDLGNYSTTGYNMSSGGIDTISISDDSLTTITLPSINTIGNSNYTLTGAVGSNYSWSNGPYTISGSGSSSPTVNISNTGIDVKEGGDIKVDGKSLKEFMTKMEQRLAILVPDPEKLEKFEALKKAYEHYKTMEALCFPEKEDKE